MLSQESQVWWLIEIAFGDLASQFNVEPKKITNHFACRIIIFGQKIRLPPGIFWLTKSLSPPALPETIGINIKIDVRTG